MAKRQIDIPDATYVRLKTISDAHGVSVKETILRLLDEASRAEYDSARRDLNRRAKGKN